MNNLTLKKAFYFVPVAMQVFLTVFLLSGQAKIRVEAGNTLWAFIVYASIGLFYIVMYCIHVSKNQKIEKQEKKLWYAGIILCSGIVSIVYYFMHIFKEDNAK